MVRLWWPNGVAASRASKQPLYTISLSYHTINTTERKEKAVFVTSKKIGFRTLAAVTDDDSKPSRIANLSGSGSLVLRYVVNGASLWIRGSNVIPGRSFESGQRPLPTFCTRLTATLVPAIAATAGRGTHPASRRSSPIGRTSSPRRRTVRPPSPRDRGSAHIVGRRM